MSELDQIVPSDMLRIFDALKGEKMKHRAFVDIEAFKAAVKLYKPQCLKALAEVAHVNAKAQEAFDMECGEHFRNICESVA